MALAIQLETLLHSEGLDYRDSAQLGGVSRTRITQIFNLLHLAPDIQEWLLTGLPTDFIMSNKQRSVSHDVSGNKA